jgi:hypothetical protein
MNNKKEDYAFRIKCQVISDAIAPVLPQEILFEPISHENGITLKRIQCVVYAILSWYEGTFSLRETIEILHWYLPDKLILKVISRLSEDIENTLRGAEPSLN